MLDFTKHHDKETLRYYGKIAQVYSLNYYDMQKHEYALPLGPFSCSW